MTRNWDLITVFTVILIIIACAKKGELKVKAKSNQGVGPGPVTHVDSLIKVEAKYVCMGMAESRLFNRALIPIKIDGKTYYGCCDICVQKLKEDPDSRTAIDPVSESRVDKAIAVLGALPDSTVIYFENEDTFTRYSDKRFKGK